MKICNVTGDGCICIKGPRTSRGIWFGENPLVQPRMVFMYQLVLMMCLSQLLHFALKRLNQPKFVGFVLAGILIGPSITGKRDFILLKKATFPPEETLLLILCAYIGMLNLIFLVAVKTDLSIIRKNVKCASYIGLTSVFSSYIVITTLTSAMYSGDDNKTSVLISDQFSFSLSTIRLTNMAYTFHELNIVASDIGQLAISAAVCTEFLSWGWLIVRMAATSTKGSPWQIISSSVSLAAFTVTVIRSIMVRICRKTPEGQPVTETYMIVCILLALLWGVLGDFVGSFYIGIFVIGLVVPSGPPLGSTLTNKIEPFVMEILMPMCYLVIGSRMNLGIISGKVFIEIIPLVFIGATTKFLGALVTGLACKVKPTHAVLLGLMLNIRGPLDLFIFFRWNMEGEAKKRSGTRPLNQEYYSVFIISDLIVTAILSPMIVPLYRRCCRIRSTPLMKSQRRSVQTTTENTQLRALCCVFNQGSVPCIASLFQALNPTPITPLSLHIVHLTELVGRAAPHIDSYEDHLNKVKSKRLYQILVAFGNYLKPYCLNDVLQVKGHSVVASYNSMHDYICRLCLDEELCLVIVPFHKSASTIHEFDCSVAAGFRTFNTNMQIHASCSVGILVDRSLSRSTVSLSQSAFYAVGVVFVGGPDDREALSLGIRMSGSPMASVTLLRVVFDDLYKDYPDKTESKLDFRMVDEFVLRNGNNNRVEYFEMEATNADDVLTGIRSCLGDRQDLIIVGQAHKIVTKALSDDDILDWSENPELGVIGDFIALSDFCSSTSLLVMQHYGSEEPTSLLTS